MFTPLNNGMIGCAIFKNDVFVGFSEGEGFDINIDPKKDKLTVRAANAMGGLGPEAHVAGTTGIDTVESSKFKVESSMVYDLQGRQVMNPTKGLYIINGKKVVIK